MIEIIDFYSTWCVPCRRVLPILEEIAKLYPDVKITKIDVEQNPEIAEQYKVKGVPSVFFEKNGQIIDKVIGGGPISFYLDILNKIYE